MDEQTTTALATLAVAAIFAVVFYSQSWWRWPAEKQRAYRNLISCSAGAAVAYVFVHLLPELGSASRDFVRLTDDRGLPFPEHRVALAALLGFMLFYGLEHMVSWSHLRDAEPDRVDTAHSIPFRIMSGSYAMYVCIVTYLMAHRMEAGGGRLALFALAMGLHFLGLGHGLREKSEAGYDRWVKHVLAAAGVVGWAVAVLAPLPESVAHTLLGFVAGAVIMNTMTSELPEERAGGFFAFITGGVVYTGILLLIAE